MNPIVGGTLALSENRGTWARITSVIGPCVDSRQPCR